MGIIATRSFDTEVAGISELKVEHEERIRNGMYAYEIATKTAWW